MNRLTAIVTAVLALTAAAGSASAQDDGPPTARVSYADLDLSNASGRATLGARVSHAVDLVCGEAPRPLELDRMAAWDHCRATARASADKQLAALYRGDRLAQSAVRISPSSR